MNRFEPLYVFTLSWHSRGLKSLNRSEPVWTGLWFFWSKSQQTVCTSLNRFTLLRCCGILVGQNPKSFWTGLNRFMVFLEQNPRNDVNRFERVYFFWSKNHESVWTGLNRFTFSRCCGIFVGLKSVWTGLNPCMFFLEQKPWNGVNRFEPVYVFLSKSYESVSSGLNRFTFLICCGIFVG